MTSADVVGFVKYDPSSAAHIFNNQLYYFEVLEHMIHPGKISNIPAFPSSSVILKPVFQPLTTPKSSNPDEYTLPAWPGYHNDSITKDVLEHGYGPSKWNNDVTITITGESDPANKTYSIKDFINFKLNSEQAKSLGAKEGDYAVLVGMHVNSRENRRWTWQTFWWSEYPDAPQSPSSSLIAGYKPASLDRAAKHYSMGVAYNMISPAQPYNTGSNAITKAEPKKVSVYAFNPYLEAGFPASTFDVSPPSGTGGNDTIRKYYSKGYQQVGAVRLSEKVYAGGTLNRVGIQTNCMSCHGQARLYQVDSIGATAQYYITDQYFPLDAEYFKSTVVLDFVWSIQGNLITKEDNKKSKD